MLPVEPLEDDLRLRRPLRFRRWSWARALRRTGHVASLPRTLTGFAATRSSGAVGGADVRQDVPRDGPRARGHWTRSRAGHRGRRSAGRPAREGPTAPAVSRPSPGPRADRRAGTAASADPSAAGWRGPGPGRPPAAAARAP